MVTEDKKRDWDARYQTNDLPWDTGVAEPRLVAVLESPGFPRPTRAIDIGCGTGTNVIYLAQRGIETIGVDVAPTAIEMATKKAAAAGVNNARFGCADFLASSVVPSGSCNFAFDRGCFHCMIPETRAQFAQRIHEMLAPGGHWLNLSGNADEIRAEGVQGPPQLTAIELLSIVEPLFEVQHLLAIRFDPIGDEAVGPLGWSCLLRRRG